MRDDLPLSLYFVRYGNRLCTYLAADSVVQLSRLRYFRFSRMLGCMSLLSQSELTRLTPPERIALISQLWDSLESEQIPLTAAQQAELDRRLDSLDQDRHLSISWTDLKSELERRCS
jgi:putative addiction module component (TIGR02574 family)